MKHNKLKKMVSSFIDDELNENEKHIVINHLKSCPECKDFIRKSAEVHKILNSIERVKLYPGFSNHIVKLIDEEIDNFEKWIAVERLARNAFVTIAIIIIALFFVISYDSSNIKDVNDPFTFTSKYISTNTKSDSVMVKMMFGTQDISKDDIMYAVLTK